MSKPTVVTGTTTVQYRSPEAERLRVRTAVATAAAIVLFPLPLLYLILLPVHVNLVTSLLLCLSVISVIAFVLTYRTYRSNKSARILLNQTQMELPGTGDHYRAIPWCTVGGISVLKSANKQDSLVIGLHHAPSVTLPINCFSKDDLDKMVSACRLWSDRAVQDQSFIELFERVSTTRLDNAENTYTDIWMQEANRRMSSTAFTPINPGTTLQDGRLKVVQPLTTGGWSAIYLCNWKGDKAVILKEAVTPPGVSEEVKKKAIEHFDREAMLLAGLDHPQIAKVLDYFVENDRQYMILQRVAGANLRSYVKDRGAVSERQTIKWTKELVDIIDYLHSRQPPIIHRDITPENLVLDLRGSLVLIDFGSANEFVGTVTGTLVGKPSYISPEQFSGHAKLQSDLYSLGAVIYFMLTGHDPEPLTAASPKEKNPEVSDKLNQLVIDLMQPDLKKRIGTIQKVKELLEG